VRRELFEQIEIGSGVLWMPTADTSIAVDPRKVCWDEGRDSGRYSKLSKMIIVTPMLGAQLRCKLGIQMHSTLGVSDDRPRSAPFTISIVC
jgi:hypothetical protein